jgi:hypothetical protein
LRTAYTKTPLRTISRCIKEELGDLRDETIGYAVAKRDECHDDERGQDVADISPVDLGDLTDHHATHLHILLAVIAAQRNNTTYQNQSATSCPRWYRGKDGRKEHGSGEA